MLDLQLFSSMLTRWKDSHQEVEKLENALKPFFDSTPIITVGLDCRNALEELLCVLCGLRENSDLLSWWAFSDVPKIIKCGEVVYNVETVEGLYNYIRDGHEAAAEN